MKKVSREQFIQFITKYPKKLSVSYDYNAHTNTTACDYTQIGSPFQRIAQEKCLGHGITSMDESNEFYIKET